MRDLKGERRVVQARRVAFATSLEKYSQQLSIVYYRRGNAVENGL